MRSESVTVVSAIDVSAAFGDRLAVARATVAVREGEFLAIVGASGSGKSTLLGVLGGVVAPTGGTVAAESTVVTQLSAARRTAWRRTSTGFIFQDFALVPYLSAQENVELSLHLAGMHGDARAALDAVGLGMRARARPAELSGGEKQRVAIARVLAVRPPLTLADEPTGALDVGNGSHALDLLADIPGPGRALVMATHDISAAARADRVLALSDGRIYAELVSPSPAEIFETLRTVPT